MACRCHAQAVQPALRPSWTSVVAPLLGGLLSSSCCVIQLGFNALQLGCAGFAALTPWASHFRAITAVALGHLLYREGLNRRSLLTLALTLALMFSQDAVRYYNKAGGHLPAPPAPPSAPLRQDKPATGHQNTHARQNATDASQPSAAAGEPGGASTDTEDTMPAAHSGHQRRTVSDDTLASKSTPPSSDITLEQRPASPGTPALRASPAATPFTADTATDITDTDAAEATPPSRTADAAGQLASAATAGAAAGTSGGRADTADAGSSQRTVYLRFQVEGIKCEGCAARLKAALLRLPGVSRCAVDFGSRQVLLWGDAARLTAGAARSAIQFVDLSYQATLVEAREGT